MKKTIFILALFANTIFCFAQNLKFDYVITQDTISFSDNDQETSKKIIKKNDIFHTNSSSDILYESWIPGIDTVLIRGVDFFIPVYFAVPRNLKDLLPANIITNDGEKRVKNLIPDYYLKIINSGNINELHNYESYFNISYIGDDSIFTAAKVTNNISNCGIYFYSNNIIIFTNIIKKANNLYECEGISKGDWDPFSTDLDSFRWNSILKNTPDDETEKFLLEIDGDYLKITNSTQKKQVITLVFVDDSIMEELDFLFRNKISYRDKLTWPHHADGTCDYDCSGKSSSAKTVSTASTNVEINKTLTTNCNLKLRSGEATSTQVLTVMSAGTKVKIIELGKAETIDGINSNWVKVEVQKNAKDRDGKPIKAGLTGWCYGGYLQ